MNEYGDGADGKRSWGNVRKNTFGRVNLKLVERRWPETWTPP